MLKIDSFAPEGQRSEYIWRHPTREDAAAIHELLLAVEAADQRGWVDTMEDRQRDFDDPASDYTRDCLLAFTPEGDLAAMGWIFAPAEAEEEYVAFLWPEVHPQHRGRGLEDAVLTWMEQRGTEILATRPAGLPRYLRANTLDKLEERIGLFERHGFEHVRSSYRMRRDLSQPIPDLQPPSGIRFQNWSPDLSLSVMEATNEAFQDHWGAIPLTEEVWNLWLIEHPNFRPELTFLAIDESVQDENPIAGLCINQVRVEENRQSGRNEAWIQELAVRRAYRRQGIASALLSASMRAFKEAGFETAGLGVDTENLTGALRIYEGLGFEVVKRFLTYSKTPTYDTNNPDIPNERDT